MLNYGDSNSIILTKHQYMTLSAIIFIPKTFSYFRFFWGGRSRIRSLFNFKYLTKNDYFEHLKCLSRVIRHHRIVLHRFHNIDINFWDVLVGVSRFCSPPPMRSRPLKSPCKIGLNDILAKKIFAQKFQIQ